MNKPTLFPSIHGVKIGLGVDYSEPWTKKEVSDIMYHLAGEDNSSRDLLFESCSNEEADDMMNPGTDTVYEAVTAIYSRLGKTAKALARVFDRYLGEGLSVDGDPYIGPNRKNALFAYKTVTLRVSDGQTVSILFHSPDDDPRKFSPNETLIAYRWMLNKKDITATVAPTRGVEVTLQIMARRMAQLLEANSAKFVEQNEAREALANELIAAEAKREDLQSKIAENIGEEAMLDEKIAAEDRKAAKLTEQLADIRGRNDLLKARIAEAEALAVAEAEEQAKADTEAQRLADEQAEADVKAEAGAEAQGKGYPDNVVTVYKTKSGKDGAVIKRTGNDRYSYSGEWGAGSIDKNEMLKAVRGWKKSKRGYSLGHGVDFEVYAGGVTPEPVAVPEADKQSKTVTDLPAGNENNNVNPDKPSSEEGFTTHSFADIRTQVASVLAEELESAGFTPHNFPTDNPEWVLGEYTPVATEQMLTGHGAIFLSNVLEDGTMNIDLSYDGQRLSGSDPDYHYSEEIQAKVPFGILESKFDDVVSQIEAFFVQFRTPLDGLKLPAMGEKLQQEGVNQHDVVDIAKAIRKDIKEILPKGFKPSFVSVKTSRFSGGAAINVSINKVSEGFKVMESEGVYSRDMLALIKVITAIGDAYRYDNSDSMTDYSDTNFFYSVDADYDLRVFDQSQNEPIEPKSFSVGDTVEWINDNGTVQGIFRGFDGADNENTVLVSNGSQMIAPTSEVFPYTETAKYSSGVNDVVDAIGVDAGKLQELLDLNLGDDINLLMDVRVDRVRETISKEKAKAYFDALEGKDLSAFEVNVKAANALVSFIKTGEFKLENDEGSPADNLDGIKKEIQAITIESDSGVAIEKLESIIARAEELGVMADLEALMIDASNHITELLGKEAASA